MAGLVLAGAGNAAQAGRASAAASAPPIVVRDLRFLGFDKDVVGRGRDAKPNGERDAHFSVVLASPRGARSWGGDLMLLRCSPGFRPSPAPGGKCDTEGASKGDSKGVGPYPEAFASTQQTVATAAILAVFRNGKQLNIDPGDEKTWLLLPRSAGGVRLDLYVNDGPGCANRLPGVLTSITCVPGKRIDHRFGAGQLFRVKVRAATDTYFGPWLKVPGKATPAAVLSDFRFYGLDKDVLGVNRVEGLATPGTPPDGKPDGHFSVELTTPTGPGYLCDVRLVFGGGHPGPDLMGGWSGDSGTVAVFVGAKQVELVHKSPKKPDQQNWLDLRWSTTPVRLDLYAPDEDWGPFAQGAHWRVIPQVCLPQGTLGGKNGALDPESGWLTLPGS